MFYKYAVDIKRINDSGRMKNKFTRTLVRSKRKKGEVFGTSLAFLFICGSVAIASVYPSKIPTQLHRTLTHPLALAD